MMAAGLAAAFCAVGTPALAGQATNTLPVAVTVATGCTLQTRPLMFDATGIVGSNPIDATTTITVKCTPNTNYDVDIDTGLHANGNSANRRMFSASTNSYVSYDVYRDSPRNKVWGRGGNRNVTGNSGTGAPLDIMLYGRVKNTGKIAAGDYLDTLTVTLNF
jgi:spore coat protein U-like protein